MNERVLLDDLMAKIAPTVPMHQATRVWTSQRNTALQSIDVMRRFVVRHELRYYQLQWDESYHSFIPVPMTCPYCKAAFFARKKTRCCSRTCAARLVSAEGRRPPARQKAASVRAPSVPLSNIIRRLRRIETEVGELRTLLENHSTLTNGHDHDDEHIWSSHGEAGTA